MPSHRIFWIGNSLSLRSVRYWEVTTECPILRSDVPSDKYIVSPVPWHIHMAQSDLLWLHTTISSPSECPILHRPGNITGPWLVMVACHGSSQELHGDLTVTSLGGVRAGECFLIYVSNSLLSNWYLSAKFGQKGLLSLKIKFLTRSANWST